MKLPHKDKKTKEICRWFKELEERSEKAEARCGELELELQKKRKDYEVLEAKFNALKEEKISLVNKLKFLIKSIEGPEGNEVRSGRENEKRTEANLEEENEANISQNPMPDNKGSGSSLLFSEFSAVEKENKMSDNSVEGGFSDQNMEEDLDSGGKRKRNRKVVMIDSESNVPIATDMRMHTQKVSPEKVRYDLNDKVSGNVIRKRRTQRNKDQKMKKWELEGDMLAAFGKDPELCMKAVCTLFRQQQMSKDSSVKNGRGFSKFEAIRGGELADFLADGDLKGELKMSVQEFQECDAERVEDCRRMAMKYSKQLFEIYKNQEDPFFP